MELSKGQRWIAVLAVALICVSADAQTIKGVVTNKTTGKPAAGDEVVLLLLEQGMQESTKTMTDGKGRFTLALPPGAAGQGATLVRVMHDKTPYYKSPMPGAESLDIDVYNVKPKVEGVTVEADVIWLQTDPGGSSLRVVENFFLLNDSAPPTTQFSDHSFEFYLPAGAVIEGTSAEAPGGMPVQSSPMPLGDANHYAFVFPIRPGQTRFQISYQMPYKGSFAFAPRESMATGAMAIMMPKNMSFKPGANAPYVLDPEETTTQTWLARNVQPSQPAAFTVSGAGQLPRDPGPQESGAGGGNSAAAAQGPDVSPEQASAAMRADTNAGKGLGNPLDSSGELDPWNKYKWWTIGGFGLLLLGAAGWMLLSPAAAGVAAHTAPSGLLQVLRDELFAAETDRLQGRLTDAEYAELKAALDVVLRRALARSGSVEEAPADEVEV